MPGTSEFTPELQKLDTPVTLLAHRPIGPSQLATAPFIRARRAGFGSEGKGDPGGNPDWGPGENPDCGPGENPDCGPEENPVWWPGEKPEWGPGETLGCWGVELL